MGVRIYQERVPGGIGAEQIASIGLYQAVPVGNVRLGLKLAIDKPDLHHCAEVIGDLSDELALVQINSAPPPSKVRLALEQDGLQPCPPGTLSSL
jgi:hypothetical protein